MLQTDYLQKSKAYKGFHYSALQPSALEYLHKRTLEMFLQVKNIFERENIKYMICGGTLLGAIGGGNGHFIPWDDDFDVCIFEEDYEKAIKCLTDKENGLSDGTVLQCKKTDPNYYLGWMKIRDRYSHTYPDAPRFAENGVWIDLYKLKKCQAVDVPVLVASEAMDYLDRRFSANGLTYQEYEKRYLEGHLKEKLEEAKQNRDKELENNMQNAKREVYVIWSASKVVLEKDWVEPLKYVSFEGYEITTFNKAEEYLKQHYGDNYSEFPPYDLRRVGLTKIEWEER